jgi:hypothetical protein
MLFRLLVSVLILACSVAASAQQAAPVYTLKLYQPGASAPMQGTTAPASAAVCGQAPSPASTGNVVNPKYAEFDDPAMAGQVCRIDFASFFGGLPVSTLFTATLSYTDANGLTSDESNVAGPFVQGPRPLKNLRVIGGK